VIKSQFSPPLSCSASPGFIRSLISYNHYSIKHIRTKQPPTMKLQPALMVVGTLFAAAAVTALPVAPAATEVKSTHAYTST